MAVSEQINHDDVNSAFASGAVLTDSNARLAEYLRVLCSVQIHSDENRLLANNRCITINTILTQRFADRLDRITTRYTWVVIVLAVATLIATLAQVWLTVK